MQDASTTYITGLSGEPLEQITSTGTPTYYYQDRLGSTRTLTNAKGSVVATYSYDAYGNVTPSSGAPINPFQYAGQYSDSESGLQYERTRYYDPVVGGFVNRDPAAAKTRQPYAYSANSPVNASDPTGLGVLEAGQATLGGGNDLAQSALGVVGQALEQDAFFLADWADTEHDRLVSGNPLAVTVGVADVFATVFTIGAGFAPEAVAERLAGQGGSGLLRVGRWMSPEEFDAMQASNAVQLSRSGVTHVAFPADAETFVSRATPGTGYVEFDIPAERLQVLGDGNARIIGPGVGDIYNTLRGQRGLAPFTDLSPAYNISDWLAMRW